MKFVEFNTKNGNLVTFDLDKISCVLRDKAHLVELSETRVYMSAGDPTYIQLPFDQYGPLRKLLADRG